MWSQKCRQEILDNIGITRRFLGVHDDHDDDDHDDHDDHGDNDDDDDDDDDDRTTRRWLEGDLLRIDR